MRLLVVEDDYLLALDLGSTLERMGAEVVGPVGRQKEALDLATREELDGAFLDINLTHGTSVEVARMLQSRAIPFAFITGYEYKRLPSELDDIPRLVKPLDDERLEDLLRTFERDVPARSDAETF